MRKNLNYNIGLDIGTSSVGWAVTDLEGNLIKKNWKPLYTDPKGKKCIDENGYAVDLDMEKVKSQKRNLWGSRLFDPAMQQSERRGFRSSRRRGDRRKYRIELLQGLFGELISQKDELFFQKLKESFYNPQDSDNRSVPVGLFSDADFSDKDYFNENKTIYHWHKFLRETNKKADIRIIYLAIHHLVKYRGNFLYEGEKFDLSSNDNIKETFNILFETLNQQIYCNLEDEKLKIDISGADINNIINILGNQKSKKKEKSDKLDKIFNKKSPSFELVKSFLGYGFKVNKLLCTEVTEDVEKNVKMSDENIKEKFPQNELEIYELIEKIYSWVLLNDILKGGKYVSEAMIGKYAKHKQDLKHLKGLFKDLLDQQDYKEFFKSKESKKINYYNYIKQAGSCSKEDLLKKIRGIIKNQISKLTPEEQQEIYNNKNYKYCNDFLCFEKSELDNIDSVDFLPKQNTTDNGAIPYQLSIAEAKAILLNQSKFYPELNDEMIDKIEQLIAFRIPYYVGPLRNDTNLPKTSHFAWSVRNQGFENEKITPWNFNEAINELESAEKFITKMTNKCSYLLNEDVLPKCSIIYSDYEVLNELNKIEINYKKICVKLKQRIFDGLFLEKKLVKEKDLEEWLIEKCEFKDKKENLKITGFQKDKEFATSRKSYIDFFVGTKIQTPIFNEVNDKNKEYAEMIIKYITLFDEKILEKKLRYEVEKGNIELNDEQIKKILKLKYAGWGRLSEKLLCKITDNKGRNILDRMYEDEKSPNFMQVVANDIFQKKIRQHLNFLEKGKTKITYDDIQVLQGSPAIKRGIWQSVKIIQEIEKIMKCSPKNIFIEFAREDKQENKGKRTNARHKDLESKYKECIKQEFFNDDVRKELNDNKEKLDDEKLFLYFIQMGKCMYTKGKLDISSLSQDCEVDHIIPQSLVKDDSIENKALVIKSSNQRKSNGTLSYETINKMEKFWEFLKNKELISKKKFENLKINEFDAEKIGGFINRQLVETRQINKHVANLLDDFYNSEDKKVNICSINANLISEFRGACQLLKVREVNDYHHANDAYLAVVIGVYLSQKYPSIVNTYSSEGKITKDEYKINLAKKEERKKLIEAALKDIEDKKDEVKKYKFSYPIYKMIQDFSNNEVNSQTGELIKLNKLAEIKNCLNYKDYFVTRKLDQNKGAFYNQTIYKNSKNRKMTKSAKKHIEIPIKNNLNIDFYGGMSGETPSYLIGIEYTDRNLKKPKVKKTLVNIPVIINKNSTNQDEILEYLKDEYGQDVKILSNNKIMLKQLIFRNGQNQCIVSGNEIINAEQLILDNKYLTLIKNHINMLIKYDYSNNLDKLNDDFVNLYNQLLEKIEDIYLAYDNVHKKLKDNTEKFESLSLEDKQKVIINILKITKSNASTGDLSLLKLSESLGRKGSESFDLDDTLFISQSTAGFFETRYKLVEGKAKGE